MKYKGAGIAEKYGSMTKIPKWSKKKVKMNGILVEIILVDCPGFANQKVKYFKKRKAL